MPSLLLYAVILFTVALVLYTVSVWSERMQGQLKTWHLIIFGLGVFVDAIATWLTIEFVGAIVFTPHAIFGFTSLFLMALHFVWAVTVYVSDKQPGMIQFHRFSLIVWLIWMVSYITGFVSGMQRFGW
ncbi:MAG: HsmA family protein [bacterium]